MLHRNYFKLIQRLIIKFTREIASALNDRRGLIKTTNSRVKTRIDNIQYRLIISKQITISFFLVEASSDSAEQGEMYESTALH